MLTAKSVNTGGLGRFGNQLFTIAGVIGIAVRSGQSYGFPKWINQDNAIFGLPVQEMDQFFVNPLPQWVDVPFQDYGYFWGYRDIVLPSGNWNIDAHMQSDKFFLHCIDRIREQFRMKDEPEQNDYVAVHIRFGDYIKDETAQHPVCSKEYYEQAMGMFPERTTFKVFTDGTRDEVYSMMNNKYDWYTCVGEPYIDDFREMKRCKSFITANSSFSSMAAILGEHPDKKVIMPRRWFGSQMPAEFGTEDIYHQNAIVI